MGHNQSKPRNKRPTPPTAPTQRLYPNLAEEFSTYGRPHTVDFHAPPTYSDSQEACFGNTIATWNGPSAAPSAPPDTEKACPNAKDGCILHFDPEQMKQHVKECLFMDIVCPLNGVIGNCAWQDKVKNIPTHFHDNHRENIGQVTKTYTLTGLRTIHLVHLVPHKFLVHIKVDEAKKKILIAVQHYNTQFCALKWHYEFIFKVNNDSSTLEKLNGTCITAGTSIKEKFDKLQCRVLDMNSSVMHAFKNGELKYVYRIMRKGNGRSNMKCPKLEADKNTINPKCLSARLVDLKQKDRKVNASEGRA